MRIAEFRAVGVTRLRPSLETPEASSDKPALLAIFPALFPALDSRSSLFILARVRNL